jgi:hypothetical protein
MSAGPYFYGFDGQPSGSHWGWLEWEWDKKGLQLI